LARVLLISSTGKHFSAGMALVTFGSDIAMDDQSPEGRAAMFDLLGNMQANFSKLESLRIPVIAAIQGGCIGGAVDMVSTCCVMPAPTRFSASRKSTSAWSPMSAPCSACPS
jgi:enoyl-CoA hydratase